VLNKRNTTIILMLLIGYLSMNNIYAQISRMYDDLYGLGQSLFISNDVFKYSNPGGNAGIPEGSFPEVIIYRHYKMCLIDEVPFLLDSNGRKRMIVLSDTRLCVLIAPNLVDSIRTPFFWGIEQHHNNGGWGEKKAWDLGLRKSPVASSYLVEGKVAYSPMELGIFKLDAPWVVRTANHGIGESVTFFTMRNNTDSDIGFYLVNGFLSFVKPYLYRQNNRIARLKIVSIDGTGALEFSLKDSPNLQYCDISHLTGSIFRVTIMDVYRGTKYDDTCLAGLVFVSNLR